MDENGKIGVLKKDLVGDGDSSPDAEKAEAEGKDDDVDLEDLDLDGLESAKSDGQDDINVEDLADVVDQDEE